MASPSPNPPLASVELTPEEITHLKTQKSQYFSTNKLNKRDLRLAIVQRILEQRGVGPDNPYAPLLIDAVRTFQLLYPARPH